MLKFFFLHHAHTLLKSFMPMLNFTPTPKLCWIYPSHLSKFLNMDQPLVPTLCPHLHRRPQKLSRWLPLWVSCPILLLKAHLWKTVTTLPFTTYYNYGFCVSLMLAEIKFYFPFYYLRLRLLSGGIPKSSE